MRQRPEILLKTYKAKVVLETREVASLALNLVEDADYALAQFTRCSAATDPLRQFERQTSCCFGVCGLGRPKLCRNKLPLPKSDAMSRLWWNVSATSIMPWLALRQTAIAV